MLSEVMSTRMTRGAGAVEVEEALEDTAGAADVVAAEEVEVDMGAAMGSGENNDGNERGEDRRE